MAAPPKSKTNEYPDDIFKDSRMSFGERIEELRSRMFKAIKWLLFFLIFGFVLDAIGDAMNKPQLGVGKPMLKIITAPVEDQVRDFYNRRIEKAVKDKMVEPSESSAEEKQEIQRIVEKADRLDKDPDNAPKLTDDEQEKYRRTPHAILKKLANKENNLTSLTTEEMKILLMTPQPMPVILPLEALADAMGIPRSQLKQKEISLEAMVIPARLTYLTEKGTGLLGHKNFVSTLSVQEGFVIYFKVSVICSIVLASPFLFYQFWAFVGAGLYPHEKRYVYSLFGPSVGLFLAGVLLCQFFVLPGAVKALLGFNEWLGLDPEIRLREWLGLALILPLVFGISFQTPLVMVALNRVGIFTAEAYLSKWRHAVMIIAVFAAVITPTPDAITMMYLFVPMMALYMLGIAVCYMYPGRILADEPTEDAEEVAV